MDNYHLYRNAWRFAGAPHLERKLTKKECKTLLKRGGLFVRNTFGFDGKDSEFWFVIKDSFGGLEELKPRTRTKIRAAQNAFEYHKIDIVKVKEEAYSIISETYADYKIKDREMNADVFADYLEECEKYNFEWWGVFCKENKKMVGFCSVWIWDDSCEYGITGLLTQYKHGSSYPYYGLYHTMNLHYLEERHFKYISDGARTITEHSNIQDYLIQHFNFRKAYCQLEVEYQWWMKTAVMMLFPFRKTIRNKNIKAVLNLENMRRGNK